MTAIDKLINNCYKEVGYKANNAYPPNRYNKYAEYLDSLGNIYNGKKNGYHWCDIFVDYMFIFTFGVDNGMKLLCQEYNGLGAGCTFSARYYQKRNQLFHTPQVGDQIFFGSYSDCGHTGIVVKVDNNYVYTIEGNTSNSVGERKYKLDDKKIYAYGRPNWEIVKEVKDRYLKLEDCPEWTKQYLKVLIDKNYLSGYGEGTIDLSMDMIRTLIICGRMCGVFNG